MQCRVTMAEVVDRKGALQATTDNRPVQGVREALGAGELRSDSNTVQLDKIDINLLSSCIINWRLYGKNQSSAAHGHTNR